MSRFFLFAMVVVAIGGVVMVVRNLSGTALPDGDGIVRGIYLLLAAAAIGGGILARGHRLGYVARSLGLWALIVLALIAGYQYRYELQDVASRVTAGLVPGSPISITEASGDRVVVLEKSASGHFEARVAVNGRPVSMMVDTGATRTVLTLADAIAAGFDPDRLSYTVPISTANGPAMAAAVTAEDFAIGVIERRRLPLLVAASGMLDQSLLGMSFLNTLSGFEVRGDRLFMRE